MSEPMKIRAVMKDDVAEIRVLMIHPMENGLRKDPQSERHVPAHFIQSITVAVAGRIVVDGSLNTAVSRNPVFGFKVKGAQAGDKVIVSWRDNTGDQRTDEAIIV